MLAGVTQVATGANFTCARLTDGHGRAVRDNNGSGQLGDGTTSDAAAARRRQNEIGTAALTGITQLSSGVNFTCARLTDGTAALLGQATAVGSSVTARRRCGCGPSSSRAKPGLRRLPASRRCPPGLELHVRAPQRRHGALLGQQRQRAARRRRRHDAAATGRRGERGGHQRRSPASLRSRDRDRAAEHVAAPQRRHGALLGQQRQRTARRCGQRSTDDASRRREERGRDGGARAAFRSSPPATGMRVPRWPTTVPAVGAAINGASSAIGPPRPARFLRS